MANHGWATRKLQPAASRLEGHPDVTSHSDLKMAALGFAASAPCSCSGPFCTREIPSASFFPSFPLIFCNKYSPLLFFLFFHFLDKCSPLLFFFFTHSPHQLAPSDSMGRTGSPALHAINNFRRRQPKAARRTEPRGDHGAWRSESRVARSPSQPDPGPAKPNRRRLRLACARLGLGSLREAAPAARKAGDNRWPDGGVRVFAGGRDQSLTTKFCRRKSGTEF